MRLLALALIGLLLAGSPALASADGAWLDEQPLATWNGPGMELPIAPAVSPADLVNPRCLELQRPPETDEDQRVADAGWNLVGPYQGGWHVLVITGASSYDGMCRPLGYQQFVFVDGLFAGTVSPIPMDSRTDGASSRVGFTNGRELTVSFARYAPSDPLCCPSRSSFVRYRIDSTAGAPVLDPISVFTSPLGDSGN